MKQRIHKYGLSNHIFSEMEDSELDKIVGDIVTLLRESLQRIDPPGVRS